ncbi:MAG TPA: DHH family phosphoesterase [Bacillaceae bacterium]|nr:DHH family phosphoesterase [Bacillaceae bacterium]
MPSYKKERKMRYPLYGIIALSAVLLIYIGFYNIWVALISTFLLIALVIAAFYVDKKIEERTTDYISTLSHRIKKVGEEALLNMPIGIMLYNDAFHIEWTNTFMQTCFNNENLIGESIYNLEKSIIDILEKEEDGATIRINERDYRVHLRMEEKLLYFFDVTEEVEIMKKFEDGKAVISIIYLDNYDDATLGMDDQARSELNSTVTSLLNKWALEHDILIKRTSSDRFITFYNRKILRKLESSKFSILDTIREATAKQNTPITLSLGVGTGDLPLPELGILAQSSLDIALGRGGDQVAIKLANGKLKFYGGKTNPIEKRTRVRARVISHALKELMLESDQVVIMGHKFPDMDAIGASIGVSKIAEKNNRKSYIVIDQTNIDKSVMRLIEEIKAYPELYDKIISPDNVLDVMTEGTLLVIVDTHKPSFVIDDRLLDRTDRIVVIDHHRRSEDFIQSPLLVYMEPYASSTAELVTELLEYQPKNGNLNTIEATALLAGIIVDTKSFTLRTGSRTFDAASYLRVRGADTVLVQKFLKEDIDTYIKRAKLIETVEFYKDGIAIASGNENEIYHPVTVAQAADTLLSMNGVSASFVLSKRNGDTIGISARSLGEVNVQLIMEALGGGGHLSNAAVQLEGINVVEAELKLKQAIDEYIEGRQES